MSDQLLQMLINYFNDGCQIPSQHQIHFLKLSRKTLSGETDLSGNRIIKFAETQDDSLAFGQSLRIDRDYYIVPAFHHKDKLDLFLAEYQDIFVFTGEGSNYKLIQPAKAIRLPNGIFDLVDQGKFKQFVSIFTSPFRFDRNINSDEPQRKSSQQENLTGARSIEQELGNNQEVALPNSNSHNSMDKKLEKNSDLGIQIIKRIEKTEKTNLELVKLIGQLKEKSLQRFEKLEKENHELRTLTGELKKQFLQQHEVVKSLSHKLLLATSSVTEHEKKNQSGINSKLKEIESLIVAFNLQSLKYFTNATLLVPTANQRIISSRENIEFRIVDSHRDAVFMGISLETEHFLVPDFLSPYYAQFDWPNDYPDIFEFDGKGTEIILEKPAVVKSKDDQTWMLIEPGKCLVA